MNIDLLHYLEFFLLPPGTTLILLIIAVMISRRFPLLSFFVSLTSVLLLVVLSMPLVARQLLNNLQEYPAIQMTNLSKGPSDGALVILGGGRYSAAPEYDYRDEISPQTLVRLRYGASLAKKLKLPIVLSGGRRNANATSEAVIMNQIMVNIFDINPQYLEVNGTNTHQQAIAVKELLTTKAINKVYLVTHAWHMKRAVAEFISQGFEVYPAPMGFAATAKAENAFLPSAAALASSSRALHEYYAHLYLNITQ